jgi:hypothetical protein
LRWGRVVSFSVSKFCREVLSDLFEDRFGHWKTKETSEEEETTGHKQRNATDVNSSLLWTVG